MEQPYNNKEDYLLQKKLLSYLLAKTDKRANAAELIKLASCPGNIFRRNINFMLEQGFITGREFSLEFIKAGGDSSFRMSVVLTAQGEQRFVDMIKEEQSNSFYE
ncbi:MAG: hypothetical protein ABIG64_07490 [Candidatus Omnitrophota bacterium]